jgi:hypothetical protein
MFQALNAELDVLDSVLVDKPAFALNATTIIYAQTINASEEQQEMDVNTPMSLAMTEMLAPPILAVLVDVSTPMLHATMEILAPTIDALERLLANTLLRIAMTEIFAPPILAFPMEPVHTL